MEDGLFTVDYESMASVMTTLIAYNIFSTFSQKIDDLPFTFVTPLGAQYDNVVTHFKNHRLLKNGFYHRFFRVTALFGLNIRQIRPLFDQPIVFLNM
ncbi:hypothetical protein D3C71_1212660 [compost metagenome]